MRRTERFAIVSTAVVAIAIATTSVRAQVEIRFEPAGQHVALGEGGSLSVTLDAPLDVRTLELWVSFDETVVTSQGGQPGQLFTGSGCPLFPIYEESEAGTWYGGAVTMGPTCYVTGPGELFRWTFAGLADGICPVRVDSLVLYDPQAEVIADVTMADTTIRVGDATTVGPPVTDALGVSLVPNPFNPGTVVSLDGRPGETASLEIFDLGGRRVAARWRGRLGSDPTTLRWDGRDPQGRALPGGGYVFVVRGENGRRTIRKGILIR